MVSRLVAGLLSEGLGCDQAEKLAERLQRVVADEAIELPDGSCHQLTASIGVANCPTDGHDTSQLLDLTTAWAAQAS